MGQSLGFGYLDYSASLACWNLSNCSLVDPIGLKCDGFLDGLDSLLELTAGIVCLSQCIQITRLLGLSGFNGIGGVFKSL